MKTNIFYKSFWLVFLLPLPIYKRAQQNQNFFLFSQTKNPQLPHQTIYDLKPIVNNTNHKLYINNYVYSSNILYDQLQQVIDKGAKEIVIGVLDSRKTKKQKCFTVTIQEQNEFSRKILFREKTQDETQVPLILTALILPMPKHEYIKTLTDKLKGFLYTPDTLKRIAYIEQAAVFLNKTQSLAKEFILFQDIRTTTTLYFSFDESKQLKNTIRKTYYNNDNVYETKHDQLENPIDITKYPLLTTHNFYLVYSHKSSTFKETFYNITKLDPVDFVLYKKNITLSGLDLMTTASSMANNNAMLEKSIDIINNTYKKYNAPNLAKQRRILKFEKKEDYEFNGQKAYEISFSLKQKADWFGDKFYILIISKKIPQYTFSKYKDSHYVSARPKQNKKFNTAYAIGNAMMCMGEGLYRFYRKQDITLFIEKVQNKVILMKIQKDKQGKEDISLLVISKKNSRATIRLKRNSEFIQPTNVKKQLAQLEDISNKKEEEKDTTQTPKHQAHQKSSTSSILPRTDGSQYQIREEELFEENGEETPSTRTIPEAQYPTSGESLKFVNNNVNLTLHRNKGQESTQESQDLSTSVSWYLLLKWLLGGSFILICLGVSRRFYQFLNCNTSP